MNREYELKIKRNRIRRKRQLRRNFILFVFSIIMVLTLSITFFGIKANAESKNKEHVYKYFKSVTVNNNDTLWDYAMNFSNDDNYQAYVDEVVIINHLYNGEIEYGMNLVIPYYSKEFIN